MRLRIYQLLLFCLLLLIETNYSNAQKAKRLSADLSLGIPVTMFSINSDPVGIYQGGLRYSFTPTLSLSSRVSYNTFFAKPNNPITTTPIVGDPGTNDVLNYKNTFLGINGYLQYNLTNLLGLSSKPKNKFIPYVTLGAGLLFYKMSGTNTDGHTYAMGEFGTKPIRNYQLGVGCRYFINSGFDAFASTEFNYIETYWMDGAGTDRKQDNYINTSIGLSYKIGATKDNNLIDWKHKDIAKVDEGTPKDYIRWSADAHLGLPVLFNPIGYNITGMGGLGLRYSFSRLFSLQLAYHYGKFGGSQTEPATPATSRIKPEAVKEFSTGLNQISLRLMVNLRKLGQEETELKKWNYYAVLGFGTLLYYNDLTFFSNDIASFNYFNGTQNVSLGFQAKKYINKKFDFITGVDFNYNGSKWLDGAGDKESLNHHLYFNAGISYKIANRNKREHIDWSNGSYNRLEGTKDEVEIAKIPVIETKPKEVPKVEEIKPIEVEKPKVEEPKIEEPKIEVPKIEVPKIEEPKIEQPKVEQPKIISKEKEPELVIAKQVVKEEPKVVQETPKETKPSIAENTEEIVPPPYKYNVIVACYSLSHSKLAFAFRDKMRSKGYEANVYRDAGKSRILKVATVSTNDKSTATQILRKAKKDIDPQSWMHLYNKH